MNEVGMILKENKKVLFPLEDYTNRKNEELIEGIIILRV